MTEINKKEAEKLKKYEDIIHAIANIDTIFMEPNGEVREWNDREALEAIDKMVKPIWEEHCKRED